MNLFKHFGSLNNLPPQSGQVWSQCDNNEHVQQAAAFISAIPKRLDIYFAHFPYKAGGVELLSAGQVCNVVSIVVDALHAAFKVFPSYSHWLSTVWHPAKTQLQRDIVQRVKKRQRVRKKTHGKNSFNFSLISFSGFSSRLLFMDLQVCTFPLQTNFLPRWIGQSISCFRYYCLNSLHFII